MPKSFLLTIGMLSFATGARAQNSNWVETTLASMTIEEKVGQLFVADLVAVYSHQQSPNFRYAQEMV
ncbi:MAG: hypothetical protein ACRENG_10175, partial [bacterium]